MTPWLVVKTVPEVPWLRTLLDAHPEVDTSSAKGGRSLTFLQGDWERSIADDPDAEVSGLIELTDNNPYVCASTARVPSPLATLSLIALGPLFRAGLILEAPVVHSNATGNCEGIWGEVGWHSDVDYIVEEHDMGSVLALTAMAVIETPSDMSSIDELFAEAYGRSFYVRQARDDEWNVAFVSGTPNALYRLRQTPDEPNSLLTIQVMADKHGKCGAAQIVHTLNVMAGFEECLGIPTSLLV